MLFSSFFQHFYFLVCYWGKRAKIWPKMTKKILLHFISQEPYIVWLSFQVHFCKMMISPGVFYFYKILIFWVVRGGRSKRVRNSSKWQKIISVALNISGTIHQMTVICGTQVWNANISRPFFYFFKILIFGVNSEEKEQKMV